VSGVEPDAGSYNPPKLKLFLLPCSRVLLLEIVNDFKPLEFVATYARKRLTRPNFHSAFGGLCATMRGQPGTPIGNAQSPERIYIILDFLNNYQQIGLCSLSVNDFIGL
jgi:hypothetical protein